MRKPVSRLSKAKVEIPEARYKADLELHDRYIGFSSELLRLALAGMAALAALAGLLTPFKDKSVIPLTTAFVWSASLALGFLTLAAACALAHRFYASDGMYHHFRAIKLLILAERQGTPSGDHADLQHEASLDEEVRNGRFRASGWLMLASAMLLALGIAAFGVAIWRMLPAVTG